VILVLLVGPVFSWSLLSAAIPFMFRLPLSLSGERECQSGWWWALSWRRDGVLPLGEGEIGEDRRSEQPGGIRSLSHPHVLSLSGYAKKNGFAWRLGSLIPPCRNFEQGPLFRGGGMRQLPWAEVYLSSSFASLSNLGCMPPWYFPPIFSTVFRPCLRLQLLGVLRGSVKKFGLEGMFFNTTVIVVLVSNMYTCITSASVYLYENSVLLFLAQLRGQKTCLRSTQLFTYRR
jgi:hypothetical protein